jgi:hypothetical protein
VLHGCCCWLLHGEWLSQQPDAPAAQHISLTEAAPAPRLTLRKRRRRLQKSGQSAKSAAAGGSPRRAAIRARRSPSSPMVIAEPVLPLADSSLIPALFWQFLQPRQHRRCSQNQRREW